MHSVFSSRTTLKSAGLIAGSTALMICAVVFAMTCMVRVGIAQEVPSQGAAAIAWESSTVSHTGAIVEPTSQTIEWYSNVDSEAVISPEVFKAARKAAAAETNAAESPANNIAPVSPNHSNHNSGRADKISVRDLPPLSNADIIDQSSFDRPVKERGPNLLPVENYPSRITAPRVTQPRLTQPRLTLPEIAPPQLAQPVVTRPQPKVEQSVIELLPPAASNPTGSNDFPITPPSNKSIASPAPKPASPFRLASAPKKKAQQLPALPSLPGEKGKGSDSKKPTAKPPSKKKKAPGVLASADSFELAAQPEQGDHYFAENPQIDARAWKSESYASDFSPDPINPYLPADPWAEIQVYEGKTLNANQRPLVELGRPWYQLGQLSPGSSKLGFHNNLAPQFLVYGDFRSSIASNQLGGNSVTRTAVELNLDIDLKLTGTERFHAFVSPLDNGQENTGFLLDDNEFINEFDAQIDFGYFEGDLGAIVGGAIGKTLPFDLPFTIGEIPLVLQNGVWLEDAFLGFAATIPARNSPRFDISNMDITFFAGYDQINSDAFPGDNSAAKIYGVATFIEANNGFWEIDYAFLEDRTFDDRSYHNIGIGFTRRYGRLLSNSTRIIVNAGQSTEQVENTADGVLLLSENSLITGAPSTVVPYFNFFAGFDRPQSAARAVQAGGILRNTGILFESDGLTGYPTLDATANDTFGAAFGLNLLPNDFSQQLVVEAALLGVMGDDANRNAAGDQYGIGVRYQLPLTNAIIFRTDAMYGFRRGDEDINGFRMELRHKF